MNKYVKIVALGAAFALQVMPVWACPVTCTTQPDGTIACLGVRDNPTSPHYYPANANLCGFSADNNGTMCGNVTLNGVQVGASCGGSGKKGGLTAMDYGTNIPLSSGTGGVSGGGFAGE